LLPNLGLQGGFGLADPGQPGLASPQLLWQLATATLCAKRPVLDLIDPFSVGQQSGRDLLGKNVGPHLRPVLRDSD
jgi:hypothetical protein